jgi:hypothetical protein
MKHIRLFIAAFAVIIGLGGALPAVASAADSKTTVCQTLGSDANCTTTPSGSVSINSVIRTVVDVLSIVIGVVSVIMIMVGGFRYVTAGGDSSSISAAKNTILYAIVGLVVAALAQVLVNFVLHSVTTPPIDPGKSGKKTGYIEITRG